MQLTSRSQYAITAMLELALMENKGSVPLISISHKEHISMSYLEQIFTQLRRHGLVAGRRGPGGGYCLGRPADKISIMDIIAVIDPRSVQAENANKLVGSKASWAQFSHSMRTFLSQITLAAITTEAHQSDLTKALDVA